MSRDERTSEGLSGAPTSSVFKMVCPAAHQSGCSLRTAALEVVSSRNGSKDALSKCEIEIFLSLARGHRVAVRDHAAGAFWHGTVDLTFPEHGFVCVITEGGERKLLDISVHTVWRPDESGACGCVLRETGNGTGLRRGECVSAP